MVWGGGGAGALREPIDSNGSFPVILTPKMVFCYIRNFSAHARFRIKHVLLKIRVAHLWLGYLNYHICYEFCELECLRCFRLWERFLAYGCGIRFLVVHHMLPKCLLFILWTPFIRCNMWPHRICTLWFLGFFICVSFV